MSRAETEHALKQANRAAKRGDLAGAERWSKTAERMSVAAERLAQAGVQDDDEEVEARRAELRDRLRRLAEADLDISAWEAERDAHRAASAAALANNLEPPPPLRAHPAGPMDAGEYLDAIALGLDKPGSEPPA